MASGSYLAAVAARAAGMPPASPLLRPPHALWAEAPAETVPELETPEHAVEPPGPVWPAEPPSREPRPIAPGSPVRVVDVPRDLAAPVPALPPRVPERRPELAELASEVAAPAPSSDDGPSTSLPVPAALPRAGAQTPNPVPELPGRALALRGPEPPPAFDAPTALRERAQSATPPAPGGTPLAPLVARPTTKRPARGLKPERPHAEPRSRPAAARPERQEAAIRIGTLEVVVSTPPPTPPPAPTVAVAPRHAAGRLARGYSSSLGLGQT